MTRPPGKRTRKPRKKPSGKRPVLFAGAGILAVILVAGFFIVAGTDRKILAQVSAIRNTLPVSVYSAPLTIRSGQDIPIFRVWHYLALAREGGTLSGVTALDRSRRTLHVPTTGGQADEIVWDMNNRIASLWRIDAGGERVPLQRLDLAPLFLGSLENGRMVEYRPVSFGAISPAIKTTFLLSEDRRFFSSPALDFRGIGRAFFHDIKAHRFKEGGSTITQQVVKILFLSRKKSLTRKMTEAFLAIRMARLLAPEEIFELYLNHIDLGGYGTERITGVEAASLRYFGRHANQLGWKEAATLAALVRAPTFYSPFLHPNRTKTLRNHILTLLYRHRLLNQKQWTVFMAAPLGLIEPKGLFHPVGPYFLDYLARSMRKVPHALVPRTLSTTMDPLLQEEADRIVPSILDRLEARLPTKLRKPAGHSLEAALIVIDPRTGAIKAMVGGRNFATSPLNRVSRSKRQPASLFKIVPYLAALTPHHNGPPQATLATVLSNKPMTVLFDHKIWKPRNDEQEAGDRVPLYRALARSMNLPVLHLTSILEKKRLVSTAQKLGLDTPGITRVPRSYALGVVAQTPLQMALAYGRIANGGFDLTPTVLATSPQNPDGRLRGPRLFPETGTFLLYSGLRKVLDDGTGMAFLNTRPDREGWAGKTGTSNRGRDTWFVALSPKEVVLAWVGFDDNSPTNRFGSQMALPLVSALISWQNLPVSPPPIPPGISFATIDSKTGRLGDPACGPSVILPFLDGTVPQDSCRENATPPSKNPILQFFHQIF